MGQFQKFQFDNFVIGEDNQLQKEPAAEVLPVEPETIEAERIVPETPDVRDAIVEEIITYSEEEVAAKEKLAEERGYELGFKTAQESFEAQNSRLLEEINNRLLMLAANVGSKECELENQALEIARTAIGKLVPVIEKENAVALVNDFLAKNFKNFKNEAKLAFYFNPEVIPQVQENIARLANIYDFEGKIALHKDASLAASDCRIEWENGGVERNGAKMLEKIDNILDDNMHQN
mgnify:FL=1